jgi:aspartyl aminopeptidase
MAKTAAPRRLPSADKLLWKRENAWNSLSVPDRRAMEVYCREYLQFLSRIKTEREAHDWARAACGAVGYLDLDGLPVGPRVLQPGSRVFRSCRGRTFLAAVIGRRPLTDGLHILGAHTDSPRLDTKPNPVYEEGGLAMLDTHYYGGIKKYQWVTIPLAIHGTVVKSDGQTVKLVVGEDPADPVFAITDLLPHLGKEQEKLTLADGIKGEGLNVLLGSIPVVDKKAKDKVKLTILNLLWEKHGLTEEDLCSADIEIVPAGPARELGLDRSMLIGYGHDDRVCAYAALRALLDGTGTPEYTSVCLWCDREEIGSVGATGMQSVFFENTVADLLARQSGANQESALRRCLERSRMISADVNAVHDPNYPDVSSPNNMAYLNAGVVISKYTGARGKAGCSEASAEFMAEIRRVFNDGKVAWQTGELGKVDAGGGGTIAMFLAHYGMDVVDCGVGLLSMHAPWEVAGKLDVFMAYKGYKAFLGDRR